MIKTFYSLFVIKFHHHHHQVALLAQISLTLSLYLSLSFIAQSRSSKLHPMSAQSCCRSVLLTLTCPYEGVHRRTSLMSSSLLLQQCPICPIYHIWIVLEMGGKWPYNCCFVGCCFQFSIVCSILVQFPFSFFTICFVSIHVVHQYSSIDTIAAWKKSHFIL